MVSGNFRALSYLWNCLSPKFRVSHTESGKPCGDVPIIGETEYRKLFHDSYSLRAVLDPTGNIEDLCDNLRELAGLGVGEGTGMPISELSLWGSEGRAWLSKAVTIARSGERSRNELDVVTSGHGAARYDLSLTPIQNDSGEVTMLLLEAWDQTSGRGERPTPEGLRETEVLGQLARLAAHDFNNLLAGIAGNLELIARRQELDETAGKRMERALRAVFRGRALTDLMDVFTREDHKPRTVDVEAVLDAVVDLCRSGLDIQLDVATEFETNLWKCRADPDRLAAALLNLMINAYDVLPRDAPILVRATNLKLGREKRQLAPDLTAGDYLLLSISHRTLEDQHGDIEPLATVHVRTRSGHVGLGLRMVEAFARQSGGDLVLADKPERQIVSRLYLPRAVEPVDE
jgi:signal transduction histidine kinase